ncbi:MAG: PEP-CTERM sorting domain-containing protein [candidate division Zixibacteria bacterium]|nr:PEP-CTERM sorting domain-containing protein [candidate division Zixibacteria bacterium]
MKKLISLLALLTLMVAPAGASVFYFQPNPVDLSDLDHYHYYSWGINWQPGGEEVTSVSLTFRNIQDWIVEPDDILYINLLDTPPGRGVHAYYDYREIGNAWENAGPLIGSWSDPLGYPHAPVDLTFTFDEQQLAYFNTFAADGYFGFGFDSDCHYFNDGVELRVETAVPEPLTLGLFSLGLVGLGLIKRKKH